MEHMLYIKFCMYEFYGYINYWHNMDHKIQAKKMPIKKLPETTFMVITGQSLENCLMYPMNT
jgi:hypothetical protein